MQGSNLIESSVPIRVEACWAYFGGSTLGYSGSGATGNFTNAPYNDTYYKTALANALAKKDLDINYDDIFITFNSNFTWYYGLDGNTPSDKMDLFSVVMHEVAHGLNFSGGMTYSGGYGWLYNSFPYVWDHFIKYGSSGSLQSRKSPPPLPNISNPKACKYLFYRHLTFLFKIFMV